MTDLLLITDVPRLLKVFSPLSEERNMRLRIATSLEKGAEELVAEKPGIVFVQTHLSGLSAEILLMHLKKQLGRRRSRFVLLCPGDPLSGEAVKLYSGHIDTALDDAPLLESVRETIAALVAPRSKKPVEFPDPGIPEQPAAVECAAIEPEPVQQISSVADATNFMPLHQEQERQPVPVSEQLPEGQTLEEQGVVYGRRQPLSVYSEFTSSFDTAVSSMPSADPPDAQQHGWSHVSESVPYEPAPGRSRRTMFLLWLAPVVIAVVAVTVLQHRKSQPEPVAVLAPGSSIPAADQAAVVPAAPAVVPSPAVPEVTPVKPLAVTEAPVGAGQAAAVSTTGKGPTVLPDFIPRYGRDKKYGAANPGWERYKGQVTEFKIFREGRAIKAIQIIDRGGRGIPESFLKAALKQLTKTPVYTVSSSEKKGAYTIQRGQVAENLSAVYYRDADGSKLRAFVVTWQ